MPCPHSLNRKTQRERPPPLPHSWRGRGSRVLRRALTSVKGSELALGGGGEWDGSPSSPFPLTAGGGGSGRPGSRSREGAHLPQATQPASCSWASVHLQGPARPVPRFPSQPGLLLGSRACSEGEAIPSGKPLTTRGLEGSPHGRVTVTVTVTVPCGFSPIALQADLALGLSPPPQSPRCRPQARETRGWVTECPRTRQR